ncbi:MAG: sugar kinase [Clostridia bacterium]|nr:sugar kinase [Clostridia bacterium]
MKKVVTFGEIMLRLSTPRYERFVQASSFDAVYGGVEANVAISLANFGLDAYFVTKLPENEIGQAAVNHVRNFGVHTNYIVRGGNRIGIYYLETGASMRPSKVIYDRAHSSIAEADVSDFDFDEIFKDADWFHFSGITPALSEKSTLLTEKALKAAKKHDVTISMDLNYRKKLWTPERAQQVMTRLMKYVDVCIGIFIKNEENGKFEFDVQPKTTDITKGQLKLKEYNNIFKQMMDNFHFKYVVSTLRKSYSASDNSLSACIYDGNEFYHSKEYDIRIVDRVGGGDSFAAGLIYGLLIGKNFRDALDFGVAASALKHTIHGDCNMVSVKEVESLLQGDTSGRIQR